MTNLMIGLKGRSALASGTSRSALQNHVRALGGAHHGRCIGIPGRDRGHDGGIDDA